MISALSCTMNRIKKFKLFITTILTTFLWSVIFYILFISHFEFTPLNIPKEYSQVIFNLSPQGWSFFTKSPRYNRLQVYKVVNDSTLERVTYQNFSSQNLYGFNRQGRQILNEAFNSLESVFGIDTLWYSTKEDKSKVLNSLKRSFVVNNKYKKPFLCGDYVFEMYEPIPWAWSSNKNYKNTKKYLSVKLKCN